MRSPSSYPGRASAKAEWAWRHLRLPSRDAPPIPSGNSGRSRRCSDVAAFRLAASSGSERTRWLQRSTPPAASRRETAATRCGHVSQNVVGNGAPFSSYGACSVTAGRPNGQRATTRRNARGRRPSWRSTMARSSMTRDASVRLQPALDPAHDEQLLARLHQSEAARLTRELGLARRGGHEAIELRVLRAELLHLRRSLRNRVASA